MCNSDPYRKADNLEQIREMVEGWRKSGDVIDRIWSDAICELCKRRVEEAVKEDLDGR
jgi:hypothetical protein